MRHLPFLIVLSVLALVGTSSSHAQPKRGPAPTDRQTILATLARQTDDWNAGRVDAFMKGYWPSDSLTFVGKGGITYGYAATLANYRKRYPDRESMGTLAFTILKLEFPGKNVAYVIGKWHLTRPKVGDAGGHFTLLWEKKKGQWLIVSDHSS